MVPKFEDKSDLMVFLEQELRKPNTSLTGTDMLRLFYQVLHWVPTDDEIEGVVENKMNDCLEEVIFEPVNLVIDKRYERR